MPFNSPASVLRLHGRRLQGAMQATYQPGDIGAARKRRGPDRSVVQRHGSDRGEGMTHAIEHNGILVVLSSPSGAGKSTMTRRLLAEDDGISVSVSVTTRPLDRERPIASTIFLLQNNSLTR